MAADDERVARHLSHEALGDRAELAVLHGAHAERAHDDEVVVGGERVLDEGLVVLAVHHLRREGEAGRLRPGLEDVQVRLGDQLEAHRDQRVVDLALALELALVLVLLRQRVFHLLEPVVVQPGGVHVTPRHPRAERPPQLDRQVDRPVRVVGVVDRNIDVLVHAGLPRPRHVSSKSTIAVTSGAIVTSWLTARGARRGAARPRPSRSTGRRRGPARPRGRPSAPPDPGTARVRAPG